MSECHSARAWFGAVLSTVLLSAFLVSPGVIYAQTLEEVIVTAQRREQSLQEVPISIEAVGGAELQQQGFRTMDDLAEFSPSIELDVRTQDQNISIRGMGTAGSSLALEQAAPVFVDGIVIGRTSMIRSAFFDLERIEVLRGPQPVYFGQNAVAGAFSLVTRKPTPQWEGNIMAEVGNFGRRTLEGGVGGPITDTLGIRVAGKYDETHGYLKDVTTNENFPQRSDRAARITLQWDPTDALSISLKQEYNKTNAGSEATAVCFGKDKDTPVADLPDRDGGVPIDEDALVPGRTSFDSLLRIPPDCGTGNSPYTRTGLRSVINFSPTPPPDLAAEETNGTGMLNVRDVVLANGPSEFRNNVHDNQEWYQTALSIEYTLPNDIMLSSLTGYVDYYRSGIETSNDSPFFSQVRIRDEDLIQLSQEFRISSPLGGMVEWMVGGYWQQNDLDLFTDNYGADLSRPQRQNRGWQDAEWFGAFATVTVNFLDDFSLDVGARYSDVSKEVYVNGFGGRYVYEEEPTGGCAGFPGCEPVETKDGLPGYTLEWRSNDLPQNWVTPVEPIGLTALDTNIRRNPGPVADSLSDSEIDPQITLRYRPFDNMSVYARYATAFKAGGYDTGVASLPADAEDKFRFDAEQGETFELGVKGEFLDGRARYDAALFNMTISDLQLATIVTDVLDTGATNVAEALNAGEQRTRGLEFSVDGLVTDNLRVRLNGAIMDGEMTKYEGAGCTPAEFDEADSGPCVSIAESAALIAEQGLVDDNGDPLDPETFAGTIDRTGSPAPRTPDWKFALMLDYSRSLMNNYMGFANINFAISDGYITNVEEFDLVQKYASHSDMNISVGFGDASETWRVTAFARNLLAAQETYNPEFDVRGDGIFFEDAGTSWYTSYGVQLQYNYR